MLRNVKVGGCFSGRENLIKPEIGSGFFRMDRRGNMTAKQMNALKYMRLTENEIDAVHDIAVDAVDKSPFGYILARAALNAYKYGVMAGKREERARRKGKAAIGAPTPTAANDTTRGSECVKCEYNTTARNMEGAAE